MSYCKDCQKRKINCHSDCEDYKKFLEENEIRKANEKRESESRRCTIDAVTRSRRKSR